MMNTPSCSRFLSHLLRTVPAERVLDADAVRQSQALGFPCGGQIAGRSCTAEERSFPGAVCCRIGGFQAHAGTVGTRAMQWHLLS